MHAEKTADNTASINANFSLTFLKTQMSVSVYLFLMDIVFRNIYTCEADVQKLVQYLYVVVIISLEFLRKCTIPF